MYLVYRIAVAAYFSIITVYTAIDRPTAKDLSKIYVGDKFLTYMTNWSIMMLTLSLLLQVACVSYHMHKVKEEKTGMFTMLSSFKTGMNITRVGK